MGDFYLTLPSNDSSIKYFPENINSAWKNRLGTRLDLDGDYEVGLASIVPPHESLLSEYLSGLNDDDLLARTLRIVHAIDTSRLVDKIDHYLQFTTDVFYKDVKEMQIETVYDLLRAIFDKEYDALMKNFVNNFSLTKMPNGENLQFEVIYDEETITFNSDVIESLAIPWEKMKKIPIFLRRDLCRRFGWIDYTAAPY